MIFVTVGTYEVPFDRLLRAVERLPAREQLVVQHGPSAIRPPGATCFDFLPYERVVAHVRDARVVVSHAGVGSVLVALANGKRPVVVPRLRRFGEVVDDHQLAFARRLRREGLVDLVEDPDCLPAALAAAGANGSAPAGRGGSLAGELRRYLEATVGVRAVGLG